MLEKLQQAFIQKGYGRIQTSSPEVVGFYKENNGQGYCICIIDDRHSFLTAPGKKDYLIRQLGVFMQEKRAISCACLGIIVTDQVERTKACSVGTEKYWLADQRTGRLVVYEDQPVEFLDARNLVEEAMYTGGTGDTSTGTYQSGWQWESTGSGYGTSNIPYGRGYSRSGNVQRKSTGKVQAFHLTPVNTCLVAINVLVFIILEIMGNTENAGFIYCFGGMTIKSVLESHQYWRLFSCAFLHFGISHLLSNMLVLAFVGDNLERALGSIKYLAFYLLGALGSSFLSCLWMYLNDEYYVVSAGASGAIFAVLGGIFYVLIKNHGHKDDLSTGKVGMFLAFSILQGLTSVTTNNSAHISGLLIGVVLAAVLYQKEAKAA